ncbi:MULTISPECIES: hypothetical protein [Streptomyces]|uniref:Uncharacterized protein n=2 Tax=Streptomyces TaxID=1883 RepID=A0A3S9PRX6_STRLT|nr:hypothetical protein [Streptomyces luteoverticillatus]AZQ75117.1 hypothetical protein EKH77_31730 [Streptomyces luteoverticillatus]
MSNLVLALAAAALTVAGTVWYLPAVAELRAGADRPLSRRVSAAGCLTGWGACAGAVPLLLAPPWLPHLERLLSRAATDTDSRPATA